MSTDPLAVLRATVARSIREGAPIITNIDDGTSLDVKRMRFHGPGWQAARGRVLLQVWGPHDGSVRLDGWHHVASLKRDDWFAARDDNRTNAYGSHGATAVEAMTAAKFTSLEVEAFETFLANEEISTNDHS